MKDSVFIGIGASAGGLEALQELLPLLPEDENYIYIIAQHLDARKKSALAEILSHHTTMPVELIEKNKLFKPNSVYILPAGKNLIYNKNALLLEEATKTPHIPTPSIDALFEALSNYKKEKCVGIILSGTGHDGSKGVKAIKNNGGITIAQSPKEAKYPAMPQNAIDSGYVDYIFALEQLCKELPSVINALPVSWMHIAKLLKEKEHLDVTKYKKETIIRRLNKRMLLTKCKHLDDYFHFIQNHPEELHLLYQTILIGVTEFFRDKEAFKNLEEQLTEYLRNKPENYDFRIWSIACSTGEEAYSLAIIVHKISQKIGKKFTLHIFATDIDDNALEVAKKGLYAKKSLKNIQKSLIKECFTCNDEGYQIKEFIRSQIVFTHHNILSDPPFINQDMISCRNFLIYILPKAQQELFSLFHYALRQDGLLFLGSSESTLTSVKYFKTLYSESKIYIKEKLKNPPKISSHYFSKHLQEKTDNSSSPEKIENMSIEENITQAIFSLFSPECIVVDASFSIVYKKGSNAFLTLPDGFVSLNIIENLQQELRYSVKKLLDNVFKTSKSQSTRFIQLSSHKEKQTFVRIIAYPFQNKNLSSFVMLYFQELASSDLELNANELVASTDSVIIKNLSLQLQELQKDNHTLLDELTVSKENMQLLNEELQSSNEELQSSNEELETSNEELQSSNEELQTSIVSEQTLQRKLSLILNSTHDGIMGLDIAGNHTFVNKAALKMLGYNKEEELLGKNAHKVWHYNKADGTPSPFEECSLHDHLKNGISVRKEDLFFKKDGTSIFVEVVQNPIVEDGTVRGAVLSFHDITQEKELQKEIEYEHQLADLYVNTTGTLVMILNTDGSIANINKKGCTLLGLPREELIGKNFIQEFIPKDLESEVTDVLHVNISEENSHVKEYTNKIIDANKQEHLMAWTNNPIKNEKGIITGIITSGVDITNEAKLSQRLFEQEHLYKLTFEEADVGIAHATLDGKWIDTNEYLSDLLGYTKDEFKAMSVAETTYKEDRQTDAQMIQELMHKKKKSYHIEKRYVHKNGSIVWVALAVVLLRDEQGEPLYLLKIIRDISQLKLLMYQLELEKNRFEKIIEFTPIAVMLYDEEGNILLLNKSFRESTGYTLQELPNINTLVETLFVNKNKTEIKQIKAYYKEPTKLPKNRQTIQTKSKDKRVGIMNAVKLDDKNIVNKSTYLIAINDITDIQQKDELMLAQSRQAAMGDMLAMIAHQWRQPLSVISMVANNVKAKIELQGSIDTKTLGELIATLNEQTQYLSHTIDDFKNFFKPDKEAEIVHINTIVEKFQHLIQKALDNNAIKLVLPQKLNITICTYQNQLLQVLINILNNAKDAIKEHRSEGGYIHVEVTQTKAEVLFKICDNGGGIKPEIREKLGEPYVTTKSENGTGLGIYMSKIILQKHLGGRLYWESDEEGSCFYVSLPNSSTCKNIKE